MTHFSDKQWQYLEIIIKAWNSLKRRFYSDQFWPLKLDSEFSKKNQNQTSVLVESKISYIGNAIEVLPIVEEG